MQNAEFRMQNAPKAACKMKNAPKAHHSNESWNLRSVIPAKAGIQNAPKAHHSNESWNLHSVIPAKAGIQNAPKAHHSSESWNPEFRVHASACLPRRLSVPLDAPPLSSPRQPESPPLSFPRKRESSLRVYLPNWQAITNFSLDSRFRGNDSTKVSSRSPRRIALLLCLIAALTASTALARSFAVLTPEDYTACESQGWALSPPVWKPDSSAVLCDKPGNVDFTGAERLALDSLGATIIDADTVSAWMQATGWIKEVEE